VIIFSYKTIVGVGVCVVVVVVVAVVVVGQIRKEFLNFSTRIMRR